MIKRSAFLGAVLAVGASTAPALATGVIYGYVIHVSVNNIKVKDSHTGQTVSYRITPSFDQVFSADGKTTYQMKNIHAGDFVKVITAHDVVGMRADKIDIQKRAH